MPLMNDATTGANAAAANGRNTHIIRSSAHNDNGSANNGSAIVSTTSTSPFLPKDQVLDHLQAMMYQEDTSYRYEMFFPPTLSRQELDRAALNLGWREKICQWSYNVVDHFDMPREIVAISMDYFDRFLASRANECSGNLALLASLTTLHVAIKIHSERSVKLTTLASLSRGQFGPSHIERMEWQICSALKWKLHPPTLFAFVSYFLMLFQPQEGDEDEDDQHQHQYKCGAGTLRTSTMTLHHSSRKELFEVAIYMAELSVCDSFFVKCPASTVAMAAICNVMEDMPASKLPATQRQAFWRTVQERFGFTLDPAVALGAQFLEARHRLGVMYVAAAGGAAAAAAAAVRSVEDVDEVSGNVGRGGGRSTTIATADGGSGSHNSYNDKMNNDGINQIQQGPSSPTSTTEMNMDDTATIGSSVMDGDGGGEGSLHTTGGGGGSGKLATGGPCSHHHHHSQDYLRYSPSPLPNGASASAPTSTFPSNSPINRMSCSPIVASTH